jgi:CheY-specific phosphatase CheX
MNAESIERLDAFLREAAIELFASHGLEVAPEMAAGEAGGDPLVSAIGFTAATMRGTLVLSVGRDLAAASLPGSLRGGGASLDLLVDWTGELSNQLLGRIKTRLCSVGLEIALSTPMVFVGTAMRHFARSCPVQRAHRLRGAGSCLVEFLACFDEGVEIGEAVAEGASSAPEGEAIFF